MSMMQPEMGGPPVPPEIMQLLAGGGGGAPVEEPELSEDELVQRIISDAEKLANFDGKVTEQERMLFDKIRVSARQFLVGREKQEQAALGGGPATDFLRRAAGG